MPEFRKDIIRDEWVIIAKGRAERPEIFRKDKDVAEKSSDSVCPFDAGNEAMTPPEILRVDIGGNRIATTEADWQIRVVPNKFPALKPVELPKSSLYGPYHIMDGYGLHEVIIHEKDHVIHLSDLDGLKIRLIIDVYAERLREIKKNEKMRSAVIMLNQGKKAGASLEHTHSQLFALPFHSPVLEKELRGTKKYYMDNGRCAMCEILDFESREGKRILFENAHFMMLEPFASRNPFETWIVPKKHASNFESILKDEISPFAQCLKMLADFFHEALNEIPFNYYIHTGPLQKEAKDHYHWHFEFIPKLSIRAGFEIAAGIDICTTTPEDTAQFMRGKIKK